MLQEQGRSRFFFFKLFILLLYIFNSYVKIEIELKNNLFSLFFLILIDLNLNIIEKYATNFF